MFSLGPRDGGATPSAETSSAKTHGVGVYPQALVLCGGRDPRGEDLHVTKLLRLVGSIWPGVRERELVGELVSPPIQSSNLIRLQKSKGVSLNWPSADKLGTHFQTWRGPGVNVGAGPFAQLLRAGGITSISERTNGRL